MITEDDEYARRQEQPKSKKSRSVLEGVLDEDFLKHYFTCTIHDVPDREIMRRVLPLAYSDLVASLDRRQFKADDMSHLHRNREEISTDLGFILAQVKKQISKWTKHDVRQQF